MSDGMEKTPGDNWISGGFLEQWCFSGRARDFTHVPRDSVTRQPRLQSLQAFTRHGAAVMQRADIGRLTPGACAD
ncbi:MAG: hypothetical protein ACKPJJ_05660, partial [Planctomycetaceae bacterium]